MSTPTPAQPERVPGTEGHADHIRQLDAKCKAEGLTDHDRHEVLKFASKLHERARGEAPR